MRAVADVVSPPTAAVAVISALPTDLAVTVPDESTVATAMLLLVKSGTTPAIGRPSRFRTNAYSDTEFPGAVRNNSAEVGWTSSGDVTPPEGRGFAGSVGPFAVSHPHARKAKHRGSIDAKTGYVIRMDRFLPVGMR
jgi:hypothetical protein